jgi:hypothetical protein
MDCIICGQPFTPHDRQICCSRLCLNRAVARGMIKKPESCICKHCGKEYKPKAGNRLTFCSRECAFAHKAHKCKACGKEMRGKTEGYCSEECKARDKGKSRTCPICGKEFVTTGADLYCSDECRKKLARDKYHQSFISVRETNPIIKKTCKYCGKEFETHYYAGRRVRCDECKSKDRSPKEKAGKREYNRRREAKKKGCIRIPYTDSYVYERDAWRCHLCGKKIRKDAKMPHPLSPTIDHIIPLSKGGADAPFNVRAAHLICNASKSDTTRGQMRLF